VLKKEDPRVATLIRRTLEFKGHDEQKNRVHERKQSGIAQARKLVECQQFEESLAILSELRRDFWDDTEISDLMRAADAGKNKLRDFERIRALLENRELANARKVLEMLKKKYSHDAVLKQLQEVLSEGEESQRKKEQIEAKLASLRKSFDSGEWKDVVKTGESSLRSYPGEPRIEELVNRAKAELTRKQSAKQPEKPARDLAPTVKAIPETGPALADSLGSAAQNAGPPVSSAPADARLGSATVAGIPATGPDRESLTSIQGDALTVVERHLATFLGPLASLLVKKARSSSPEPEAQLAMMASSLRDPRDHQAFLARKDEMLRCLTELPLIKGRSLTQTLVAASAAQRSPELTPEAVRRASELLTQYLGPISRILTDRAANRAENLQALYYMLSEHVKDASDRAHFLSDAGFPPTMMG
jgi:hypothetical protein